MAQSVRDRLRSAQEAWNGAETRGRDLVLPQGDYQFRITGPPQGKPVIVEDRDKAIRARIVLEIVGGPDPSLVGKKTTKSWTLLDGTGDPNDVGLSILKGELERLGIETVVEMDQIGDVLDSLTGAVVDAAVVVKTGNDGVERSNVYFNGMCEEPPKVRGRAVKPEDPKATKKTTKKAAPKRGRMPGKG